VVHDRSDTLVPFAHGERYAALIPGAQLFATTGLGHLSLLRDAAVVQRVVEFVTAS
jgi:pimeloyl-ACP methyl ester carboxylesterase